MEPSAHRAALAADHEIMLGLAATPLDRRVPTCPDWTLDDLVRHVSVVYLHKVVAMRAGQMPSDWPPSLEHEATAALLARSYAELTAEFDARDAHDAAHT